MGSDTFLVLLIEATASYCLVGCFSLIVEQATLSEHLSLEVQRLAFTKNVSEPLLTTFATGLTTDGLESLKETLQGLITAARRSGSYESLPYEMGKARYERGTT